MARVLLSKRIVDGKRSDNSCMITIGWDHPIGTNQRCMTDSMAFAFLSSLTTKVNLSALLYSDQTMTLSHLCVAWVKY